MIQFNATEYWLPEVIPTGDLYLTAPGPWCVARTVQNRTLGAVVCWPFGAVRIRS